MPEEPDQARRFDQARKARSTALLEDYVELIADLTRMTGEARATDIAKRLGVTHPTAIKTIGRLKAAGFATSRPYRGVFLTEAGLALAARMKARHRLVVEVLKAIGVPVEAAEADGEGIEHHVSETTLEAFAAFLRTRSDAAVAPARVALVNRDSVAAQSGRVATSKKPGRQARTPQR